MIGWAICLRWRRSWWRRPVQFEFEQGIAAARVAIDRYRQLDFGKFAVCGGRRLRLVAALLAAEQVGVALAAQRVVDRAGGGRVAADDCPVALVHRAGGELATEIGGNVAVEAEEQTPEVPRSSRWAAQTRWPIWSRRIWMAKRVSWRSISERWTSRLGGLSMTTICSS
jgi:hypothetical protein